MTYLHEKTNCPQYKIGNYKEANLHAETIVAWFSKKVQAMGAVTEINEKFYDLLDGPPPVGARGYVEGRNGCGFSINMSGRSTGIDSDDYLFVNIYKKITSIDDKGILLENSNKHRDDKGKPPRKISAPIGIVSPSNSVKLEAEEDENKILVENDETVNPGEPVCCSCILF